MLAGLDNFNNLKYIFYLTLRSLMDLIKYAVKIFSFIYLLIYYAVLFRIVLWTCFFLSVRKMKNQPSNKLLLALFFIQIVKEGNIRE